MANRPKGGKPPKSSVSRETLAIWTGSWGYRSDAVIGRSQANGADHPYLVLEQINYLLSKVK